jgi:hypothetical protein
VEENEVEELALILALSRIWKLRDKHALVTRLDFAALWAVLLAVLWLCNRRRVAALHPPIVTPPYYGYKEEGD